jgi:hypothetical protein
VVLVSGSVWWEQVERRSDRRAPATKIMMNLGILVP